jgi:hypothetical protein
MEIERLWFTQKILKRSHQICDLVKKIEAEEPFVGPPIVLQEAEDGEIEIINGHHRVVASWKAGLKNLRPEDYQLFIDIKPVGRIWQVKDFEKWRHLVRDSHA